MWQYFLFFQVEQQINETAVSLHNYFFSPRCPQASQNGTRQVISIGIPCDSSSWSETIEGTVCCTTVCLGPDVAGRWKCWDCNRSLRLLAEFGVYGREQERCLCHAPSLPPADKTASLDPEQAGPGCRISCLASALKVLAGRSIVRRHWQSQAVQVCQDYTKAREEDRMGA